MSTKVPTFIGKPIDDIKAVNAELYAKYNQNKEAMDAIEIQMSKINVVDGDKPYIRELSEGIKSKFQSIAGNPFEMPYANTMISDTFKNDIITNKKLNGMIERKSQIDSGYQEIRGLYNPTEIANSKSKSGSSSKGSYSKRIVDNSSKIFSSLNQGATKFDENGEVLNPVKNFTPVPEINLVEKVLDHIGKLKADGSSTGLRGSGVPGILEHGYVEKLTPDKIKSLANLFFNNDADYMAWKEQEVLFNQVENAELDENGLIKYNPNGTIKTNYDYNTLKNNTQFRNFLKYQNEDYDAKANSWKPKVKEIGAIGTNNEDFDKYYSGNIDKMLPDYYNFIANKRQLEETENLVNAFKYQTYKADYKNDNFALERYKLALGREEAKKEAVGVVNKTEVFVSNLNPIDNVALSKIQEIRNRLSTENNPAKKAELEKEIRQYSNIYKNNIKKMLDPMLQKKEIGTFRSLVDDILNSDSNLDLSLIKNNLLRNSIKAQKKSDKPINMDTLKKVVDSEIAKGNTTENDFLTDLFMAYTLSNNSPENIEKFRNGFIKEAHKLGVGFEGNEYKTLSLSKGKYTNAHEQHFSALLSSLSGNSTNFSVSSGASLNQYLIDLANEGQLVDSTTGNPLSAKQIGTIKVVNNRKISMEQHGILGYGFEVQLMNGTSPINIITGETSKGSLMIFPKEQEGYKSRLYEMAKDLTEADDRPTAAAGYEIITNLNLPDLYKFDPNNEDYVPYNIGGENVVVKTKIEDTNKLKIFISTPGNEPLLYKKIQLQHNGDTIESDTFSSMREFQIHYLNNNLNRQKLIPIKETKQKEI